VTAPLIVTGAGGNLGRRVVDRLAPLFPVLAVDRFPPPSKVAGVEHHLIDLALPSAATELDALAKEAAVIVHLAWQPEGKGNLDMTRHVLSAATGMCPAQLVHVSSAMVYGAWPDNPVPLTEDAAPRPNPQFSYAVQKRAAEALLERWSTEHRGTKVVLLRPACTLGSTEQPLYRAPAAPRHPPLSSPARMVQFLHVDDLAEAVVHAVVARLAGTYNVAPDSGVSEEEAGAIATGAASLPAPARTLLAAWDWFSSRRSFPAGAEAYAEHSWVVSPGKLASTGWRPQYSSAEALLVTDAKGRWDDLPQPRRVALTLAAAGVAAAASGAGGAALWRRRR